MVLDRHLLEGEIRAIFRREPRDEEELRVVLEHARPVDIADLLSSFDEDEKLAIFRALGDDAAAVAIAETDEDSQLEILEDLDNEEIADIVESSASDDATDLLGLLEKEDEREVLKAVEDRELAEQVRELLAYDPESAGGVMTKEVVTLSPDVTIGEALEVIRASTELEDVSNLYAVDEDERLVGVVSLRDLVEETALDRTVGEVMERDVVSVRVDEDQEEVSRIIDRYDFSSLPVLDEGGRLVGVVTVDDAIDVMHDEADEDIFRLAGTGNIDLPLFAPVLRRIRVRLPWLLITLVGGLGLAVILTQFQETFQTKAVLAAFMPVIAAMAGNLAMQSSAMLVRGFATGEVELRQSLEVLMGEFTVGLAIGAICGAVAGVAAAFIDGDPSIGWVVGISMSAGMTVAIIVGTAVPLLCQRLKIDPAVAAGPFVTTLNDITGLTTYLATASLFLT